MLTWKDIIHHATHGNRKPDMRVEKTEAEWKAQLTPDQYYVTRQKGTERPFSGEHCSRYDPGVYNCVCCGTPLFDSNLKFPDICDCVLGDFDVQNLELRWKITNHGPRIEKIEKRIIETNTLKPVHRVALTRGVQPN